MGLGGGGGLAVEMMLALSKCSRDQLLAEEVLFSLGGFVFFFVLSLLWGDHDGNEAIWN